MKKHPRKSPNGKKRTTEQRDDRESFANSDFEASLALQRRILASYETEKPGLKQETKTIRHESSKITQPVKSMPGFYYDQSCDRFFKVVDSAPKVTALHNSQGKILSKVPSEVVVPNKASMVKVLYSRQCGQQNDFSQVLQQVAASKLQLAATPSDNVRDLTFHKTFGLACITETSVILPTQIGTNLSINLKTRRILSAQQELEIACWQPSTENCILGLATSFGRSSEIICLRVNDSNGRESEFSALQTASVSKSHFERTKICSLCWKYCDEALLIGSEAKLMRLNFSSNSPGNQKSVIYSCHSPIVAIHLSAGGSVATSLAVIGHRNGAIQRIDSRIGQAGAVAEQFSSLPFCVDHIALLQDGTSVVAQDITGQVSVFDVRKPNMEYLRVINGTKKVRSRRFWLSDDEKSLVASHPSVAFTGLGIFSLRDANTLIRVAPYPWLESARSELSSELEGIIDSRSRRSVSNEMMDSPTSFIHGHQGQSPTVRLAPNCQVGQFGESSWLHNSWYGVCGIVSNLPVDGSEGTAGAAAAATSYVDKSPSSCFITASPW